MFPIEVIVHHENQLIEVITPTGSVCLRRAEAEDVTRQLDFALMDLDEQELQNRSHHAV